MGGAHILPGPMGTGISIHIFSPESVGQGSQFTYFSPEPVDIALDSHSFHLSLWARLSVAFFQIALSKAVLKGSALSGNSLK